MKKLILLSLSSIASFVLSISTIINIEAKEDEIDISKFKLTPVIITYDITQEQKEQEEVQDLYEKAIENMNMELEEINSIEDTLEWYLAYKEIVFKYTKWVDPPETIFDYFSEEEVRMICKVVETETFQCDFDSKVNVANVVLNRYYSGLFGESIHEVITSKNQFAYGRNIITEDTILAVMYAFEFNDTTQGSLYFHSYDKTDKFCGRDYIFSDEAVHHFYK